MSRKGLLPYYNAVSKSIYKNKSTKIFQNLLKNVLCAYKLLEYNYGKIIDEITHFMEVISKSIHLVRILREFHMKQNQWLSSAPQLKFLGLTNLSFVFSST